MKRPWAETEEKHVFLRSIVGICKGANKGSGIKQFTKVKLTEKLINKEIIYNFSNSEINKHCNAEIDLYYSSYYSNRTDRVLWNVDNDMKDATLDILGGELTWLEEWQDKVIPAFFKETKSFASRGGIGSHSPFWVVAGDDYKHYSNKAKNSIAANLAKSLEFELERFRKLKGYKFTKVEIKGTNSCFDYKTGELKFGSLCLLPRTDEHIDFVKHQAPTLTFNEIKKLIENLRKYNNTLESVVPPVVLVAPVENTVIRPDNIMEGSWRPRIVEINQSYGDFLLDVVLEGHELRSNCGRYIINKQQINVCVSVIKALQESDIKTHGHVKHMSFKRIKKLWLALIEAGDTDVPYCDRAVTAIRNAMSEHGFIEWHQHEFWFESTEAARAACVFSISKSFFLLCCPSDNNTPPCVVTSKSIRGTETHQTPIKSKSVNPFLVKSKKFIADEESVLTICV